MGIIISFLATYNVAIGLVVGTALLAISISCKWVNNTGLIVPVGDIGIAMGMLLVVFYAYNLIVY